MRILIAAGGTGGHVYPALAVLRSLAERQPDLDVRWLGGRRGLERTLVPQLRRVSRLTSSVLSGSRVNGSRISHCWKNKNKG